jgi:hypothetical protein
MGTVNLVRNPSFDGPDGGNWSVGTNFADSATGGNISPHCIAQTSPNGFDNLTSENDSQGGYVVLPSTNYVFSFFGKVTVTSGSAPGAQINITSAFGATLAAITVTDTAGVYQRFSIAFTTGASDTEVWFRLFNNNGNVTAFYDNFQLELGTVATAYMDGKQPGCRWLGTVDNSISTRLPVAHGNHVRHAFARVV